MRTLKLSALTLLIAFTLCFSGCDELKDLRIQNETQRKRIASLESELRAKQLEVDQMKRELAALRATGNVNDTATQDKIVALEDSIARKEALIRQLRDMMLGGPLPAELNTKLEDFAKSTDMVEFDPQTGIVKFKSDLLFELGSDIVAASAVDAVKALCTILSGAESQDFGVIVAGHTDDVPIGKPETRAKHPTNWHLSAHRAISVLNIMAANGIDYSRLSVRGFGEYRPIEPNVPKTGNAKNRRVEIYVVRQGA